MELWAEIEELKKNTDDIQFKLVPESKVAYILFSENLKYAYDTLFQYL